MEKRHTYNVNVTWTGNTGRGTASYKTYARDHAIAAGGKPPIAGSSDASFRGDAARWNPEELLVASLSTCHQLWYLHLCADAGVVVLAYTDDASGTMRNRHKGASARDVAPSRAHTAGRGSKTGARYALQIPNQGVSCLGAVRQARCQ